MNRNVGRVGIHAAANRNGDEDTQWRGVADRPETRLAGPESLQRSLAPEGETQGVRQPTDIDTPVDELVR